MELTTNTIYNQTMPSFRVPGMTQKQTIEWFCSGRQCGVALEDIIAFQFDNTNSDATTQGESADLWVSVNGSMKSVQMKTANTKTSKTKIRVGKSSLFDSKSRRTAEEIKSISDKYFSSYDYFMVVDISEMPQWKYRFILIPSDELQLIDSENVKFESVFNDNRTIIDLPFKDVE
jgi:hypothetical protein